MSPKNKKYYENNHLIVRALRTNQKSGINTYSFFLPGSKLIDIANISRIKKDVDENLKGFQRKDIKNHPYKIKARRNCCNSFSYS